MKLSDMLLGKSVTRFQASPLQADPLEMVGIKWEQDRAGEYPIFDDVMPEFRKILEDLYDALISAANRIGFATDSDWAAVNRTWRSAAKDIVSGKEPLDLIESAVNSLVEVAHKSPQPDHYNDIGFYDLVSEVKAKISSSYLPELQGTYPRGADGAIMME